MIAWKRVTANRWALGAVPLVIFLQVLAVEWGPLARVLRTVPLARDEWLTVAALSVLPAVVGQVIDLLQERRA